MASIVQTSHPTYANQTRERRGASGARNTGTIVMDREAALARFASELRFREAARPYVHGRFIALVLLLPALIVTPLILTVTLSMATQWPAVLIAPVLLAVGVALLGFWIKYLALRTTEVRTDCVVHRIGRFRTVKIEATRIRNWSKRRALCGRVEVVIGTGTGKPCGIPSRRPAELLAAIDQLKSASRR